MIALLAVAAAIGAGLGDSAPSPSASVAAPAIEVPRRPSGLDPALSAAVRAAAADAAVDGVELRVVSGRRTPAEQRRLLEEAVSKYGSFEEAARWVATPERSAHVSGDAVDVGPSAGIAWLAANGAAYGLCQIYANEPWHFELRRGGCPAMYADPTEDPRM